MNESSPSSEVIPSDQQPPVPGSPHPEESKRPKPLLTKAIGSVICGLLSIPACFCAGVPSLILGALAIYLGFYVQRNFKDSTAGEVANVYAWIGVVLGVIGLILGGIIVFMMLTGGTASLLEQLNQP